MPASAGPPSLALKNLICVALGLPSVIVQATIVPACGARSRALCASPTLTWKPVVRLTARHGLAGQLGTVAGRRRGITPTSVSVAGATAGQRERRARGSRGWLHMCVSCTALQHAPTAGCSGCDYFAIPPASSCAAAAISSRIARRRAPRQPQRIALVARDHVHVEVEDRLPGGGAAGVEQVHAVGAEALLRARRRAAGGERDGRADPRRSMLEQVARRARAGSRARARASRVRCP